MNKKFLISLFIILSIIFSFTLCFANTAQNMVNDVANGTKDFINGVENATENVVNGTRNAIGTTENTAENITSGVGNTVRNITNDMSNNMDNYTTTRVATENNFMGMTNNAWTWFVVGITAIAIIALIWYYSMQYTNNNHHDED